MAIKAYLYNGGSSAIELEPRNGPVYRDEYNETRDSATIVVRSRTHLDVEPFDFVEISGSVRDNDIDPKYLCVDSVSEEQTSFGDDPSYDTTITLFSETKEMERVTLPNLSITTKPDGTSGSVYDYILKFINHFAPRIKVVSGNSYVYEPKWDIDPSVQSRFSAVKCPEFSWNRPTLSEVITDLMQVEDCIPVIRQHVLSFIDLRKRNGEADDSNFVRVVRGISSQDYNQSLDVNMQNAISSKPAHMVEYISMRNESSAILTTDNMMVITQKPIYEIKKVTAIFIQKMVRMGVTDQPYRKFREVDITDSVKEKMAYDVLNPTPVTSSSTSEFQQRQRTHQIANVWFTRGSRSIEGFGKSFQFPTYAETAISYILRCHISRFDLSSTSIYAVDFRDVMFKVEYLSQGETAVKAGRMLPLRNIHNSAFDNQGSSYVDVRQQSLFEYAKANRLANRIIEINGTCTSEEDVPALGQTYQKAVIFSREIQYQDDMINFHLLATENYVLANYFTSIRAKRRSWAIASGKEALTRHETIKMFVEFSRSLKAEATFTPVSNIALTGGPERLLSALYHFYNDESVKNAAFFTTDSASTRRPIQARAGQKTNFILDCQASATGMSVSLSVQLQDNYSVGEKITIDENGRYINNILPYADSNGEFRSCEIRFLSYYDPADGQFVWGGCFYSDSLHSIRAYWPEILGMGNASPASDAYFDQRIAKGREKPVSSDLGTSETQLRVTSFFQKDNREIFALTAQVEYCSDDPDIIVKERMADKSHLVYGQQDSDVGLPVLASQDVKMPAELPTPSSAYQYVGFLCHSSEVFGDLVLRFAKSALDGSNWVWNFFPIADGQKYAVLDGYEESQNDSTLPQNARGSGSRVIIVKIDERKIAVTRFERDFRLFTIAARRLEKNEDKVPDDATVSADVSSIDIRAVSQNSVRVYYGEGYSKACWGLCDADGYVLFAVNRPATGSNSQWVYVNASITRDHTIRESVGEQHVVTGSV